MIELAGYASVTSWDSGKVVKEADTFLCCHCGGLSYVPTKDAKVSEQPGYCGMCHKNTCARCCDNGGCHPFEKKLERAERGEALFRAIVQMTR